MTSFEDYPLTSSTVMQMQMQIEGHGIGTMNEVLKTNTHSDNISNSANANANAPHFCQTRGYFGRIFHTIQIGALRVILKYLSLIH